MAEISKSDQVRFCIDTPRSKIVVWIDRRELHDMLFDIVNATGDLSWTDFTLMIESTEVIYA